MSFYSPLDGAVVASYPWDHYTVNDYFEDDDGDDPGEQNPEQKTGVHATPDDAVFHTLAGDYAQNNPGKMRS